MSTISFENLLQHWEENFKKGQLSFWILLSLKDKEKYVQEIQEFIENLTDKHITGDEQTLYRSLRKFYEQDLVNFTEVRSSQGPLRKYYFLTESGQEFLKLFIDRNIRLFFKEKVVNVLNS